MARSLVIIPAFNEAPGIAEVVGQVREGAPDFDVVVIDDGSSDDTAALAAGAGAVVVAHPFNLGYGAALQTGYMYAVRNGYDVAVQLDADGQHESRDVGPLAEPILAGQADAVFGTRFHDGSSYRMPLLRRLGSRWFGWLIHVLTGVRASDPTTGFQALSAPVLDMYTTEAFPVDYPDADMIVLLSRNGFRVAEVPVRMYEKPESRSMHSGAVVIYYVYKMTLAVLMNAARPRVNGPTEAKD